MYRVSKKSTTSNFAFLLNIKFFVRITYYNQRCLVFGIQRIIKINARVKMWEGQMWSSIFLDTISEMCKFIIVCEANLCVLISYHYFLMSWRGLWSCQLLKINDYNKEKLAWKTEFYESNIRKYLHNIKPNHNIGFMT